MRAKIRLTRLIAGLAISIAAVATAGLLAPNGAESASGTLGWFVAVTIAAAALHMPAVWAYESLGLLLDAAIECWDDARDIDHPPANRDAWRAGRKHALRGLIATLRLYMHIATKGNGDLELDELKAFQRNATDWANGEIHAARTERRPLAMNAVEPGMNLDGAIRPPVSGRTTPADRAIEETAWQELKTAMSLRHQATPEAFRPYFDGSQSDVCLGWRKAAHQNLVKEMKSSTDVLISYMLDREAHRDDRLEATHRELEALNKHVTELSTQIMRLVDRMVVTAPPPRKSA